MALPSNVLGVCIFQPERSNLFGGRECYSTRSIPQLSAACLAAFQCHDSNCPNLGYMNRSSSAVVNSLPYASNARVTARWLRPTRYDQFGGGWGIILGIRRRPADFGKVLADETEKWAKVVKFVGIKLQ